MFTYKVLRINVCDFLTFDRVRHRVWCPRARRVCDQLLQSESCIIIKHVNLKTNKTYSLLPVRLNPKLKCFGAVVSARTVPIRNNEFRIAVTPKTKSMQISRIPNTCYSSVGITPISPCATGQIMDSCVKLKSLIATWKKNRLGSSDVTLTSARCTRDFIKVNFFFSDE